jgi:hypothetical protein
VPAVLIPRFPQREQCDQMVVIIGVAVRPGPIWVSCLSTT